MASQPGQVPAAFTEILDALRPKAGAAGHAHHHDHHAHLRTIHQMQAQLAECARACLDACCEDDTE